MYSIGFLDYIMKRGYNFSRGVPKFDEWAEKMKSGAWMWTRRGGRAGKEWGLMPFIQIVGLMPHEYSIYFRTYMRTGLNHLFDLNSSNFDKSLRF